MNKLLDFEFDIYNNKIAFDNNETLKPANCILPYTQEHIDELKRCKNDIIYFAENYIKIVHIDHGLIPIQLRDYQKKALLAMLNNRFLLYLASRQIGKTTTSAIFFVWYILFNDFKTVAILANKEDTANEILSRVKTMYSNLPKWLQQGVVRWSATSIELENGSKVFSSSSSSSAVRGKSISLLFVDEIAFINQKLFDSFYSSIYPTISSGKDSKVIFVSTPNGKNHFYKLWEDAKRGKNTFKTFFTHWSEIPERDEKWKQETIANIGEKKFLQEYECDFQGSSNTLISPHILENLVWQDPIEIPIKLKEKINDYSRYVKIYEDVLPNKNYIIGVDSSKKSEEIQGDAIAIQVITADLPHKQVATIYINDNEFVYYEAPELIYHITKYYNNAYLFIENNEIGQEIADILFIDYEYENIYFEKKNLPGFRTTKRTKRLGCSNLKTYIEFDKLIINDFETIQQLTAFVNNNKGSYEAEKGYSDDLIMALIACLFYLQTQEFYEIEDRTIFLKKILKKKEETIEEPISFFSTEENSIFTF